MSSPCMYRVWLKALIHNERGELLLTYEERKQSRDLPGWGLEHSQDIVSWLISEIKEELWEDIGHIVIDPKPVSAWPCLFENGFALFLVAYKVNIDITRIHLTEENEKRWFFSKDEVATMQLYTKPSEVEKLFI